jgi:hypothetical protein
VEALPGKLENEADQGTVFEPIIRTMAWAYDGDWTLPQLDANRNWRNDLCFSTTE